MRQEASRVAIVTGAGSGIGAASAKALAEAGFAVAVADIDGASAQRVAAEIGESGGRVIGVEVDIAELEQVQELINSTVEFFGGIDVLHNNAADTAEASIRGDVHVVDLDLDVLDRAYAVNLRGTVICCKLAIPHMVRRGGGSIINTSSTSSMVGDLMLTSYGVTKAAVNTLTKYIATQYGKHGIRCNAIVPGLTLTPSVERNLDPDMIEVYEKNILSRAFARPEDVAELVVFLASAPEYLTGDIIRIDGGQLAHAPAYSSFLDRGWGVRSPGD